MLNPYTFPLVPYPGLAPELALRSGMGGWEPYAQAAPADRLLPFVVTRAQATGNSRWLNCARIEHADTGVLIADLAPVGYTLTGGNALDLPFRKYVDTPNGVDHFVYFGGIIQGLTLPCGVPLRLVVDTEWQGPRFRAVTNLSGYLLLEWWDNGPANGVPYGTGFRQRLYVENGALQFTDPTTEKETTKNAATGEERLDYLAKTNNASLVVPLLPAYLAEAVSGAEASAHLTVDSAPWQVVEIKSTVQGTDGGRWSMAVTVKQQQVLKFRASCPAPALADAGYSPFTDAARPWRCGDTSDVAPDYQPTGAFTCDTDENGNNGFVIEDTRDINPNSPSYNQASTAPAGTDFVRCPLAPVYYSLAVSGMVSRNDCPDGQTTTPIPYTVPAGQFNSRVDQATANALAQDYYTSTAQAYANANGLCSAGGGITWLPVFDPMGCFACLMRNANDPSDVRGATAAEAAQYFRATDNDGLGCVQCNVAL